jgi:hypothetical protein
MLLRYVSAKSSFNPLDILIHETIRKRGLLPSEWRALSRDEKVDIVAYEMDRTEKRNKLIEDLYGAMKDKLMTTDVVLLEVIRLL